MGGSSFYYSTFTTEAYDSLVSEGVQVSAAGAHGQRVCCGSLRPLQHCKNDVFVCGTKAVMFLFVGDLPASLDFFVHLSADVSGSTHYSDWKAYNSSKVGLCRLRRHVLQSSHSTLPSPLCYQTSSTAYGIPFPAPPCGGSLCSDSTTWFNSVDSLSGNEPGPVPTQMKLTLLSSLLTPAFFPLDKNITSKGVSLRALCHCVHVCPNRPTA
jgi:hypothetical protein